MLNLLDMWILSRGPYTREPANPACGRSSLEDTGKGLGFSVEGSLGLECSGVRWSAPQAVPNLRMQLAHSSSPQTAVTTIAPVKVPIDIITINAAISSCGTLARMRVSFVLWV